jgi:hypothetical protein
MIYFQKQFHSTILLFATIILDAPAINNCPQLLPPTTRGLPLELVRGACDLKKHKK